MTILANTTQCNLLLEIENMKFVPSICLCVQEKQCDTACLSFLVGIHVFTDLSYSAGTSMKISKEQDKIWGITGRDFVGRPDHFLTRKVYS